MRCGNASKSMWLFESEPREGRLLAQHRDLILVWKDLLAQRRDLGPLQIKTTTQQVKLLFLLQLMARHHLFTILNLQLPPPSTLPTISCWSSTACRHETIYSVTYSSSVGEFINIFAQYISPKLVQPSALTTSSATSCLKWTLNPVGG